MNAHKRIALCLFFVMVVTACANVTTPIPFSSPIATSIPTQTLIPITPTIPPTIESSLTVDPNAPPDGTGQLGADGLYHKSENGVDVTWNPEVQTFERHLNADDAGVPLVTFTTAPIYNNLFLYMYIDDTIPGSDRVGLLSLHPGVGDQQIGKSFHMQFPFDLERRSRFTINRPSPIK